MTLYELMVAKQGLERIKSEKLTSSIAFKIAKIGKEIEEEVTTFREVMQGQAEEKFGVKPQDADKDTQRKMEDDFLLEASKTEVSLTNKLTTTDVDNIMLTVEEATAILPIIEE